jgi:beta-glucanase (GH16 family)
MKILRQLLVFATASFLVLGSVIGVAVVGTTSAAHAASWNQVWDDEFNGSANSAVDSQWQFDLGTGWGNNQEETDTNSTNNIYQDGNGHLVIKPINSNGSWTSGRIETTSDSLAAPAGGELEVTASIQLPNVTGAAAQGYWPAFWMLGAGLRNGGTWPSSGEIDAMESVNGTNVEYGTLHCGVDPGGPCNETTGLGGNTPCTGTTCQAGFHTYTVIVDRSTSPEQIRWYLDGTEFWHVSSNNPGMDATTWANAVDHGFFVILNVAMGGYWPGYTTASTQSGAGMNVDYVRAYTSSGSVSAPVSGYNYIQNRYSGDVLDDTGWSTTNGTQMEQWAEVSGQANQQWNVVPTGDGYYYIQNRYSGDVLDDTGWSTTNGTVVEQWAEGSGQANQEWGLVPTGDGYYYVQNRYSGDVLDDTGWSTTNGTVVEQWAEGSGQANQEWNFIGA